MTLNEYSIVAGTARKSQWIKDYLAVFIYVMKSDKFPTLKTKAARLTELHVPTIRGRKLWDVRNLHKLNKEFTQQGLIK